MLGNDFAGLIERARGRVAADLEQGEDVVVGQQLARSRRSLAGARRRRTCRTSTADRRCRPAGPRRPAARPGPAAASPADPPASTAALGAAPTDRAPLPPENMRMNSSSLGKPSLTSSCGRPGVSAIHERQAAHRRPRRRRARRGGEDRRQIGPAGDAGDVDEAAAPRHRIGERAAHRRQAILDRRRRPHRPAGQGRRARPRDRRSSSRPGARRAPVSSRRCSQASKASNSRGELGQARQRGDERQREVAADAVDRRHQHAGEGRARGRTPRSAPGDEQEAPGRRVEIGVEPAVAEGCCAAPAAPRRARGPRLDEVGLEPARREIAERSAACRTSPGSARRRSDVHGSTRASHGVIGPRASPGTGTAASPSGGTGLKTLLAVTSSSRLAAFEQHRHDEALRLRASAGRRSARTCGTAPTARRRRSCSCPASSRGLICEATRGARPGDGHRRGVAGEELEDRAVDLEVHLLHAVFHLDARGCRP